jgi:hypothetical protein
MPDPISRLVVARAKSRVFGDAHQHSELVAAVLTCATIDQAAVIAAALVEEDAGRRIVPAHEAHCDE